MAVLEVRDVWKAYGSVQALRGVDLVIQPGEIVGLLGRNGAGKTTLVSIVAGLRRPDRGTVAVGGVDVLRQPDEAREHIGLAPQDLGIYPMVTVRENLVLFGELAGLGRREVPPRIDEVADALGLCDLLGRVAGQLSGGERRRLHTAIALLARPQLLLLDEPTTGADVPTRSRLLEVVRRLAADGAAVCYSTHYLAEVEGLGATVAIIDEGRVVAHGPLRELIGSTARAAVELTFEGDAPGVALTGRDGFTVTREGSVLRVLADDPGVAAAAAMAALGDHAARLRTLEIVQPSLETVFLTVTGRSADVQEPSLSSGPEVVDATAP